MNATEKKEYLKNKGASTRTANFMLGHWPDLDIEDIKNLDMEQVMAMPGAGHRTISEIEKLVINHQNT